MWIKMITSAGVDTMHRAATPPRDSSCAFKRKFFLPSKHPCQQESRKRGDDVSRCLFILSPSVLLSSCFLLASVACSHAHATTRPVGSDSLA